MSSLLQLFKTRRFLPLFVTMFFGAFNDNAFKNALLIWFTYAAAQHTNIDPPMMVVLAAGIFILPFFLFSATAGQLAERSEKASLVVKIKTIEIFLMFGCGLGFYLKSVPLLLFILFMMGVQSTFFGPIKYSLLPEHLKKEELVPGNGLVEGGTFLAILLGTIFGGLIVMTKYGVILLSLAVIFFAVVGLLGSRSIPVSKISAPGLPIGRNIILETWRIVQYAKQNRTVWLAIIGISWMWFVGAMFLMQFPTYTKEVIGGNERIVTFFLTLFSVGIAIGSVLCHRLVKGKITAKLVPYGAAGMSLCIFMFSFTSYLYLQKYASLNLSPSQAMGVLAFFELGIYSWIIVINLLLLAVFAGIFIVPLYAIMQYCSDKKYISRVIAGNNIMNALFMVSASLMSMVLFSIKFHVTDILLIVGVMNVFVYLGIRKIKT